MSTLRTPPSEASAPALVLGQRQESEANKKRKYSDESTGDHGTGSTDANARDDADVPIFFQRMFSTILQNLEAQSKRLEAQSKKLDDQSKKLDDQSSELTAIRQMQQKQADDILEVKRLHLDLAARMTTVEEDVSALKIAKKPAIQASDPIIVAINKRQERDEIISKKTNIIIRGLSAERGDVLNSTRAFLQSRFREGSSVQDAFPIDDGNTIMAKLLTVGAKDTIMANKSKALANTNIFIDGDLTERERFVAYKVRSRVRAEKKRGNNIKFSHQRIFMNNSWLYWDDEAEDFIPPTNFNSHSEPRASASTSHPNLFSNRPPPSNLSLNNPELANCHNGVLRNSQQSGQQRHQNATESHSGTLLGPRH